MADKNWINELLADVENILVKTRTGMGEVQKLKDNLSILKEENIKFSNELKAFLISSYDNVRSITVDICNDVRSFDIFNLAPIVKDDKKIDSYQNKKEYILNKCSYVENRDDWSDFIKYLNDLAKVFDEKSKRVDIINNMENLADYHYDILSKTDSLFSDIKKDLEKALKEE